MSSCFTVDTSVYFDDNVGVIAPCFFTADSVVYRARAHKAIIAGSGAYQNSTMHSGIGNINYVSYHVRRIKFMADYVYTQADPYEIKYPDYAVLFKVPYREPVVTDNFILLKDFMLYKEPEKVLGYDISSEERLEEQVGSKSSFSIDVTKSFIVGPNDYVGVFYFLSAYNDQVRTLKISGTATVWFDPV